MAECAAKWLKDHSCGLVLDRLFPDVSIHKLIEKIDFEHNPFYASGGLQALQEKILWIIWPINMTGLNGLKPRAGYSQPHPEICKSLLHR